MQVLVKKAIMCLVMEGRVAGATPRAWEHVGLGRVWRGVESVANLMGTRAVRVGIRYMVAVRLVE